MRVNAELHYAAPQIITFGMDLDESEFGINFYEKYKSHHA